MVGLAMGVGVTPVWLFRAEGEQETLLEYYLEPDSRPDWELISYTPGFAVVLERENIRFQITVHQDHKGNTITYLYLR